MAQRILDALRSNGVLTDGLQEKLSSILPGNGLEKLSGILQRYEQLDAEEKKQFLRDGLAMLKQSLRDETNDLDFYTRFFHTSSYTVFLFAVLSIVLVLGTLPFSGIIVINCNPVWYRFVTRTSIPC